MYTPIYLEGKNSLNLIRDEVRVMPTLMNKSDLPVDSSKITALIHKCGVGENTAHVISIKMSTTIFLLERKFTV